MLKLKLNSRLFISLQPQFATIEATGNRNFIIKKTKSVTEAYMRNQEIFG